MNERVVTCILMRAGWWNGHKALSKHTLLQIGSSPFIAVQYLSVSLGSCCCCIWRGGSGSTKTILRPFGSVGTLTETQQLLRMETKCPGLSLPRCLGGKGCRSECRGWQEFRELLPYLVTIVLNYGFPSVLGEASTSQICSLCHYQRTMDQLGGETSPQFP